MHFKLKENKLFSVMVLLTALVFILIPYNVKSMTPTRRTKCRIYSRIVGYYSSTDGWNLGKKAEWEARVPFSFPTDEVLKNNDNQNE